MWITSESLMFTGVSATKKPVGYSPNYKVLNYIYLYIATQNCKKVRFKQYSI